MKKPVFILILCLVLIIPTTNISAKNIENPEYEIDVLFDAQYKEIHLDENFIYAMSPIENEDSRYDEYNLTIFDYQFNQIVPPIYKVEYSYGNSTLNCFYENRMRVKKDSKFGYIDTAGALIVDAIYESAGDYKNGVATAMKDGLWGVIDIHGNVVVDFLYSYIDSFSDGKAIAQKDGIMGVLDAGGNFLELPYGYLSSIENGYIFAGINDVGGDSYGDDMIYLSSSSARKNYESLTTGDFGFIDTEGNIIYPFELKADQGIELIAISHGEERYQARFYSSCFTAEGIAFVKQDSEGDYGLINTAGELLYDFVIDSYITYLDYHIGKQGKQRVFFDKQGYEMYRIGEYDNIQAIKNYLIVTNYAHFELDVKSGILTFDGEVVLPCDYYGIYGVNGNTAIVEKVERNYELIDLNTQEVLLGGFVSPINERLIYFYNREDNTGYLADWRGNKISEIDWEPTSIGRFYGTISKEDYIEVDNRGDDYFSGVIDKYGNLVIEPKYGRINDSYIPKFDLPLIELKYLTRPTGTNNNDEPIKTEYFDYNGDLVYYCVGNATYDANGVEIYDFPIILDYYNAKSYNDIYRFRNQNNRVGLVRIKQTKSAVRETEENLYMKLFIGGPIFVANGKNHPTDKDSLQVVPIIENGRALVPIRVISEAMGAGVDWDDSESKVTITSVDKKIELWIDNKNVLVNNEQVELDVSPVIYNSRTFVPLRFVSEALGANVEWKGETQTIIITKGI